VDNQNQTINQFEDLDAEMTLLGTLMLWGDFRERDSVTWTPDDIQAIVEPDDFNTPCHSQVYRRYFELFDSGIVPDLILMMEKLSNELPPTAPQDGRTNKDEWESFLVHLVDSCADPANGPYHARIVRGRSVRRAMYHLHTRHASELKSQVISDDAGSVEELRLEAIDKLESFADVGGEQLARPVYESLAELTNPRDNDNQSVKTGLRKLDDMLDGGLGLGSLTVVGARPSCGKTSLGLTFCLGADVPSLFFSAEMTRTEIDLRVLSMTSDESLSALRSGAVDAVHFEALRHTTAQVLKNEPLFLVDDCSTKGARDAQRICTRATQAVKKYGVKLVVVDYLGRLSLRGKFDRNDLMVGAMVDCFKDLALSTGVAVVLMSQFNRSTDGVDDVPSQSDFKDSGKIEEIADNLILIQAKEKYESEVGALRETILTLAKARQGNVGVGKFDYDTRSMRFENQVVIEKPYHPSPGKVSS